MNFGYYLLKHYIGVVFLQTKLEHFAENTTITEAYIVGTGHIYKTFYINSEFYLQFLHINKLQININFY